VTREGHLSKSVLIFETASSALAFHAS